MVKPMFLSIVHRYLNLMTQSLRKHQRKLEDPREISFTLDFQKNPLSSVLIEYGETKVICSISFSLGVPKFLKGTNTGWLTAEYGMLPSSTSERSLRESAKGKQTGRTLEIQRLIGRVLRNCVKLEEIGENTLTVDCDVIHADGGTRTASITGASVALKLALDRLMERKKLPCKSSPFLHHASAISVGLLGNDVLVDLDYHEDSHALADMNFVLNSQGDFLEIQASAEESGFNREQFTQALHLATECCQSISKKQEQCC